MRALTRAALLSIALALACANDARADAADDWSGTEDWSPPRQRRPVERYTRARRELDEAIEEHEEDQRFFDREQAEFMRDRASMLRDKKARETRADRSATDLADPTIDAELRKLEQRALQAEPPPDAGELGEPNSTEGTPVPRSDGLQER